MLKLKNNDTRQEQDSLGTKQVPVDAYYGVHSVRAKENFDITGKTCHPEMIISIAQIKKAAAIANFQVGRLTETQSEAIIQACDEIIAGKLHDQFITDPIQGGAGTSFNMNANEVVANRAIEILGGQKGDYSVINPNDHVNYGQSTNDVYPSSGRLTLIKLLDKAQKELVDLRQTFLDKAEEFDHVIKMGRTQLQDAVPIRLGQEFHAYASAIQRDIKRFDRAKDDVRTLNLGGTAIGTGINADIAYVGRVVSDLEEVTGLKLYQAEDLIDGTQNLDEYVSVSGIVKSCAVSLSKISNDLRLMSSGPRTGIGEINLPEQQAGSSIMPGKVNPVIPEVVSQVAFNIIGNDMTVTMAVEAGQLELNAFEPVLFYNLFESIETLGKAVRTLIDNCVKNITANEEHCKNLVDNSVGIVTAVAPHLSYKKTAAVAKEAIKTGAPVKELLIREKYFTDDELELILNPFNMTKPGVVELKPVK